MDKDLKTLYNSTIGNLMLLKCKNHNYSKGMMFFSQKEFEENQVEIFTITDAYRKMQLKLKE